MDQNHSKIPWKGTQGTFTSPLSQMITGIKEHGYGVCIYPSVDSINKGANLTIQILLSQLEDWKNRHKGNYPTTIYLQVDGYITVKYFILSIIVNCRRIRKC